MSQPNFEHDAETRDHFNDIATQSLLSQAETARHALLQYSAIAVRAWAMADNDREETADLSTDAFEPIELYTERDNTHAFPGGSGDADCLTLLLRRTPDTNPSLDRSMRILMPLVLRQDVALFGDGSGDEETTSDDLETDALAMLAEADEALVPQEMFFEVTAADGKTRTYIISRENVARYVNLSKPARHAIKERIHSKRPRNVLQLRVDTGLPIVSNLHQNLVNMERVPQRTVRIARDGESTESI